MVVDTVDGLRRNAPRTIEFHFPTIVDPRQFASLEGVRVVGTEGPRMTLAFHGAVAPLLRIAAEHDPIDVIARQADLDELFLSYYRDGGGREDVDAN